MLYLYRVSKEEDFDFFLELKSEKEAIKWSGFDSAPDPIQFKQYFINQILNNPKVFVYYLKESIDNRLIGYVQFNQISDTEVEGRGTNILKVYQGCGYMEEMSQLMLDKIKEKGFKYVFAYASEKNIPSIHNLIVSGYKKTDEYEMREMKGIGEVHKFYKWVKEL